MKKKTLVASLQGGGGGGQGRAGGGGGRGWKSPNAPQPTTERWRVSKPSGITSIWYIFQSAEYSAMNISVVV